MIKYLIGLLAAVAALGAVEFPGTWSNGKGEFKTISLMLRSDGQAVFTSAVLPAYARWEKTDTGLMLTIGGDGKSLRVPVIFDEASATLRASLQDTDLELRKVSDYEPPDMLGEAKAKHAAEQNRWKGMIRFEERALAGSMAVYAFLEQWLQEDAKLRSEPLLLEPTDGQPQLTVSGMGNAYSFEIWLEIRQKTQLTGYPLESRLLPNDATSDLPLSYEISEAQREALANLALVPGVRSSISVFSSVSVFETERFFRKITFYAESGDQLQARALAEQILGILWQTSPREVKAQLQFRVEKPR